MGKFCSRSKDGTRSYPPLPINRTLKLHLRVPSIQSFKTFYERQMQGTRTSQHRSILRYVRMLATERNAADAAYKKF